MDPAARAVAFRSERHAAALRASAKGILGPEVQDHHPSLKTQVEVSRAPNKVDHSDHWQMQADGDHILWQVDDKFCTVEHAPSGHTYPRHISLEHIMTGGKWGDHPHPTT